MKNLLLIIFLGSVLCACGGGSSEINFDIVERQRHLVTENEQVIMEAVHRLSMPGEGSKSNLIPFVQQGFELNRSARDRVVTYLNNVNKGNASKDAEETRKALDKIEKDSREWRESLHTTMHPQPKGGQ